MVPQVQRVTRTALFDRISVCEPQGFFDDIGTSRALLYQIVPCAVPSSKLADKLQRPPAVDFTRSGRTHALRRCSDVFDTLPRDVRRLWPRRARDPYAHRPGTACATALGAGLPVRDG